MIYNLFSFKDFVKDKVLTSILSAARSLFYSINSYIYELIIYLYDTFIALCHGKLLDSNTLNALFGRIGVILGLVMFMYVAFSFVQVLIDPDSFNDKQKGIPNIIVKIIKVIVMLGLSGYAFTLLANIQSAILNENVISKLIMPTGVETEAFGNLLSSQLFLSFYTVRDDVTPTNDVQDEGRSSWCSDNVTEVLQDEIVNNKNFSIGLYCLDAYGDLDNPPSTDGDGEDFLIDYNFVFCTIVGIVVCYLLLNYCISVGIRIVQLAVLQIISPMAIVSFLSPKQDNMFSKWIKKYISTYIDVFIRIAIINFMVYLSGFVLDSWNNRDSIFWESVGNPTGGTRFFIGILMIIALLSFAKKAPELIKDLFPQSDSKLGFGLDSGAQGLGILAGAAGGLAGGIAAGSIGGAAVGLLKGGFQGFNSKGDILKSATGGYSSQRSASIANKQRIAAGGSRFPLARIGAAGRAQAFDAEKAKLESQNSAYGQLSSYFKNSEDRAKKKILDGKYAGNPNADKVTKLKLAMESHQATIERLNPADDGYAEAVENYSKVQTAYNKAMDAAVEDYMNDAINNDDFDAVIKNNVSMAETIIKQNSSYDGFKGQSVGDYKSFKAADGAANGAQAENTNKLVENSKRGERARADAQYKGK